MFRKTTFIIIICCTNLVAQNTSNPKIRNAAIFSFGTSASLFSKISFLDSTINLYRSQTLPAINIGYDLASNSNLTFGVTLFAETFNFYSQDTSGMVYLNNKRHLATKGNFSNQDASFIRINPGIKVLYHYIENNNDVYSGIRIGYEIFTTPSQKFVFANKLISKKSIQVLIGYRRFVDNWAFNCEVAVGKPNWFYAGASYKLIK
jgi:hypothetical protein